MLNLLNACDRDMYFKIAAVSVVILTKFLNYCNAFSFNEAVCLVTVDKYIIFILYGYIAVIFDNNSFHQKLKAEVFCRYKSRRSWINSIFQNILFNQLETVAIVLIIILVNSVIYSITPNLSLHSSFCFCVLYIYLTGIKLLYLNTFLIFNNRIAALTAAFSTNTVLLLYSRLNLSFSMTSITAVTVLAFFAILMIAAATFILYRKDLGGRYNA